MKHMIVAGIGGQGINVLTKVLADVCRAAGHGCQYTVHKGGAQSLGTVYGELRVADGALPILGAGIPKGKLDLLVALDPWETLRHLPLAHARTRLWSETAIQPAFSERRLQGAARPAPADPVELLKRLPVQITWRDYRRDALKENGSAAMANYRAGLDCLSALGIDAPVTYQRIFFEAIRPAAPAEKE